MAYTKYSLTPANNNATPPDGAPEGMLPSAVNDTMRDMMAQIRDVGDGIRDGTYTMTAAKITGGTITGVALTGNTFTNPVISGGSIYNTPIGASTANTGAFTTLSATGATTFSGATVVSGSLTANTFSSSGATITGGSVSGITDLAIADGGTGASTAAAARTNLGLDGFVNMKNRIINGAMVIDQRNAGASGTSLTYTIDRWAYQASQNSKGTWGRNLNSVTPPVGFSNYLGFQSSSAYTVGSSERFALTQYIEGFNASDLGWGTANAKTVTLSFWVYSSLTGTFGGSIAEYNNGYPSYPFSYTISSANTWEQKSVTITGPTSGSWTGASNNGFAGVIFSLGSGSAFSGTAGSWNNSTYFTSATGATSVVGTNGATFYITGVQLEVGSTATSFDYRPYGTELALCQRYYFKSDMGNNGYKLGTIYNSALSRAVVQYDFHVKMRAQPTATYTLGAGTINTEYLSTDYVQLYLDITTNGNITAFAASAEL